MLLLTIFAVSFPLALYAYYVGSQAFAFFEGAASFAFWFSIVGLVFLFPMRYVVSLFSKYIRTLRGSILLGSYWTAHLILYGLILEGIVAYSFRIHSLVSQLNVNLASIPIYPVSVASLLAGFAFNPSIDIFIPPVYVLALSFYTISISFIIAVLVLTNIMKVAEIGKMCTNAMRSRALVVMPALGVIGGAACCLSLPVLISLAAPTAAIFSSSPIVYYSAYFVFPTATAFGLKFNMDSTNKISSSMSKIVAQNKTNRKGQGFLAN